MPNKNVSQWENLVSGRDMRPLPDLQQVDLARLQKIIRERRFWKGSGSWVYRTEEAIEKYLDVKYALLVNSGTTALEIAIRSLGLAPGSEIIVPAYSFYSTASSVVSNHCVPVFVDIDPHTYCLDVRLLEKAVTRKTKAIVPVHMAGFPCDVLEINRIARKHRLFVIEDAAQAFGAIFDGRQRAGALGDVGCFSFQQFKNISCGEGGLVVTNSAKIYRRLHELADCGRRPGRPPHEHFVLGSNYRMTELQASLLYGQILRCDRFIARKQRSARYFWDLLSKIRNLGLLEPGWDGKVKSCYTYFVFKILHPQIRSLRTKQKWIDELNRMGFPCYHYPLPLYRFAFFKKFTKWRKLDCPQTERACYREAILVPHEVLWVSRSQIRSWAKIIEKAVARLEAKV